MLWRGNVPTLVCHNFLAMFLSVTGLILGLRPANERRRYKVTLSLTGWAQTLNQSQVISAEKISSQTQVDNQHHQQIHVMYHMCGINFEHLEITHGVKGKTNILLLNF